MKFRKINEYGSMLQDAFINKTEIKQDIDLEIFDGYWRYEKHIKTILDAVGYMLECYDYEALLIIDEWIEIDHTGVYWGFDANTLKLELEKCFE